MQFFKPLLFFLRPQFPLFDTIAPFPCCTQYYPEHWGKNIWTHVCGGGSHDTKTAQWNGRVRVTKEVSQDTVVANIIVFFFCHGRFTLVVVGGGGGMERTKGGGGAGYATRGADETAEHQNVYFFNNKKPVVRRSLSELVLLAHGCPPAPAPSLICNLWIRTTYMFMTVARSTP
jgi:hypothetical protein